MEHASDKMCILFALIILPCPSCLWGMEHLFLKENQISDAHIVAHVTSSTGEKNSFITTSYDVTWNNASQLYRLPSNSGIHVDFHKTVPEKTSIIESYIGCLKDFQLDLSEKKSTKSHTKELEELAQKRSRFVQEVCNLPDITTVMESLFIIGNIFTQQKCAYDLVEPFFSNINKIYKMHELRLSHDCAPKALPLNLMAQHNMIIITLKRGDSLPITTLLPFARFLEEVSNLEGYPFQKKAQQLSVIIFFNIAKKYLESGDYDNARIYYLQTAFQPIVPILAYKAREKLSIISYNTPEETEFLNKKN